MKFTSFLRDKVLLYLLHFSCMAALAVFLCATAYPKDACLLILICWVLVLGVWTGCEYSHRKRYFSRMEAVIAQIDQRFLLGELMPFSDRLEDRLYRELIRQSNRSVIEKIHAAEDQKKDYRAYIESWVHEIKAPITSISLICENHKNEVTRSIRSENSKIENLVERTLYLSLIHI